MARRGTNAGHQWDRMANAIWALPGSGPPCRPGQALVVDASTRVGNDVTYSDLLSLRGSTQYDAAW